MKSILNCLLALLPLSGFSQARIIFNGANILITQNGSLVISNPAPNALTVLSSGGIISESAENNLVWNLGSTAANYTIPFMSGTNPIPVSFSSSGGTGNGSFTFSTYAGSNWQNSLYLPPAVTNMDQGGTDNSIRTIDRFWQINASGYSTQPALSNLLFTYNDKEWNATGNSISEADLAAQNYNSNTNVWMTPAGTDNPATNQVTIASVNAGNSFPWWTLSSVDFALPLTLLDFTAEKVNNDALLKWLVTSEINVDFYEIQRSIDAVGFKPVGQVTASANPGTTQAYSYTDTLSPGSSGTFYYRLRMVDKDSRFSYSPVKFISFSDNNPIRVFPNPVTNLAVVRFGNQPAGSYDMSIFNAEGRQIETHHMIVTPNSTFYFPRAANMPAGAYIISITGSHTKQAFTLIYQ